MGWRVSTRTMARARGMPVWTRRSQNPPIISASPTPARLFSISHVVSVAGDNTSSRSILPQISSFALRTQYVIDGIIQRTIFHALIRWREKNPWAMPRRIGEQTQQLLDTIDPAAIHRILWPPFDHATAAKVLLPKM